MYVLQCVMYMCVYVCVVCVCGAYNKDRSPPMHRPRGTHLELPQNCVNACLPCNICNDVQLQEVGYVTRGNVSQLIHTQIYVHPHTHPYSHTHYLQQSDVS